MKKPNNFINKYLLIGCIIFLAVGFQSCEKMVETKVPSNQIGKDAVFNSRETITSALSTLYTNAKSKGVLTGGMIGMTNSLGWYTDELTCFWAPGSSYFDVFNNTMLATNRDAGVIWTETFNNIYVINAFIEGVNKSDAITENEKAIFLGEAHFLRAVNYHFLVQMYGDIPYVKSTDYNANKTVKKMAAAAVIDMVEEDLLYALSRLPINYRSVQRIYPNKSACELMLAKNYLLKKDYGQAATYADKVLNNPILKMEADLNKVFKKTSTGTVWQFWVLDNVYTLEADNFIFPIIPPYSNALEPKFLQSFDPSDKRKVDWVKEVTQGDKSWSHPFKYKVRTNNMDEYSVVLRLEDAYLLKAEALAHQNKINEALPYLNATRLRAGLNEMTHAADKNSLITEILKERRFEFFTEMGARFFDLKRNGKLADLKVIKPNWKEVNQLWPIPESELLLNKGMLPQNEGY